MEKNSWVAEEIKAVNLCDKRLKKRLGNVLEALGDKPTTSIPLACRGWGELKAAYRFFDNEKVNEKEILNSHRLTSIDRIKQEKVVLLLQDTTDLNYTGKNDIEGLGKIGNDYECYGIYLHAMLAVTPERISLGCVNSKFWTRQEEGIRAQRGKKKIEDKESYRWIEGFKIAEEIAKEVPNTLIVNVADRESDIYEFFLQTNGIREKQGAHWIVRSAHNRNVTGKGDKKIWEGVRESPVIGEIEFAMPQGRKRKARQVKQEVKLAKVKLNPFFNRGFKEKSNIEINAVLAEEINAPRGAVKAKWMLLTSLPITSYEQAVEIIQWYLCRWQIEIFFKLLKSGCGVEELQLEKAERLRKCIALYLIIAWRILFVTMQGRKCPDMPCDTLFEDDEWKSVYMVTYKRSPPKTPPRLQEMIIMIAKLGGFIGRKSDGEPGAKTIWQGMQRMRDFAVAWDAFNVTTGKRCG